MSSYERIKQEAAEKHLNEECKNSLNLSSSAAKQELCELDFKAGCDHEHERAKVLVEALKSIASGNRTYSDIEAREALRKYKGEE